MKWLYVVNKKCSAHYFKLLLFQWRCVRVGTVVRRQWFGRSRSDTNVLSLHVLGAAHNQHGAGFTGTHTQSSAHIVEVKAASDASRDAVPSETPPDGGRRCATASSGEWMTWSQLSLTVRLIEFILRSFVVCSVNWVHMKICSIFMFSLIECDEIFVAVLKFTWSMAL
jgi:hypothetical protein